jgi:hypothetical protein
MFVMTLLRYAREKSQVHNQLTTRHVVEVGDNSVDQFRLGVGRKELPLRPLLQIIRLYVSLQWIIPDNI